MKTIVIGDIHGCYNELTKLISMLEENGCYNKDKDKLVFLGDYIDRGKDSRLVIEFIRNMQKDNKNVIALMGNHESMLLDYYAHMNDDWAFNGYYDTLNSYAGFNKQLYDDIEWMKNLPLYYEDDYFIYVHAGVDVNKPMNEQKDVNLLWIREPFIYNKNPYYKRIIFGHTPTVNLNFNYKPVYTASNNIDIDTACVFGGKLTALIIEDDKVDKFYQVNKETEEVNLY